MQKQLKELTLEKVVHIDTSDEASITAAAEQLKTQPIDLLIKNAGICGEGSIDQTTKTDMMKQFEINAVGPFLMTRAFLPNLKLAWPRAVPPRLIKSRFAWEVSPTMARAVCTATARLRQPLIW
ncbi:hypothetical protein PI124_g21587 [Phytophthora idaei]|nr:hypothetical protein PI125_g23365 [Phytophthora idaei]KAG3128420.1 hypothetical protein PI126_g21410 [Phytophthora idaei]KAG3233337.1 hypothetical protein PI124_g21587 [Phytophthora idaei]